MSHNAKYIRTTLLQKESLESEVVIGDSIIQLGANDFLFKFHFESNITEAFDGYTILDREQGLAIINGITNTGI